jgi:hypothetical protein
MEVAPVYRADAPLPLPWVALQDIDDAVGIAAERSDGLLSYREKCQRHGPHNQQYTNTYIGGQGRQFPDERLATDDRS